MPARTALYVTAGWVVATLGVLAGFRGHGPTGIAEWLSPLGPAVALSAASLTAFDHFIWRWRGISKLVGRPMLYGTWHGTLESHWINPESGQRNDPDPDVFLVVRQRFWSVSVRLLTRESTSRSQLAELVSDPDGVCQLVYVYANTPRSSVREESAIHNGTVILGAPRDSGERLEGHYFTDRGTLGELRLTTRYKQHVETHAAARGLVEAR